MYAGAFVVLFAMIALLGMAGGGASDGGSSAGRRSCSPSSQSSRSDSRLRASGWRPACSRSSRSIVFSVAAGSFEDLIGILDDDDEGLFDGFRIGILLFELVVITAWLHPPRPLPVPLARATRGLHELVLPRRPRVGRGEVVCGRLDLRRPRLHARRGGRRPGVRVLGTRRCRARHRRRLPLPVALGTWDGSSSASSRSLFFLLAGGLDRSSYAVLGAIGLFLSWTYFVEKWTDAEVTTPIYEGSRPVSLPTPVSRASGAPRCCTRSSGSCW